MIRRRWRNLLGGLREIWRKPAPEPPAPRLCGWCDGPLPADAAPNQLYCKPVHARKARERRNGRSTKLSGGQARAREAARTVHEVEQAWRLNSSKKSHAASCDRKRAYETFGEALIALRWLRDAGKAGDESSVYRCHVCSQWHITTTARKPQAAGGKALEW